MGEQMQLVGVKLPSGEMSRLDREVALWSPFITKRGPMARALIEIAFVCIEAGIVERRPIGEQGLLRKLRATSLPELTELPELAAQHAGALVEDMVVIHGRGRKR